MSDVGDAIELTYATTPGATVSVTWRNTATGVTLLDGVPVPEILAGGQGTGSYAVTLVGAGPGTWEARFTAIGTATGAESFYERFDAPDPTPPLATLGEYTELYGNLSAARSATARALLRRASMLVRDTYRGIDARIAAGTVSADNVGLAVINMVARVLRNPSGLRSETTGPFSRSYDTELASGMLSITATEQALLVPPTATTGARGKLGTIRINGGMVPPSPPWNHNTPRGVLW